ncbi:MAG TPA: response regulator [Sedimentisphaerales bacterium]|nr:response regulator [Sedimentisphaerales bacterium]HRS12342.1 response regulator [Sedimentisphaerales bacterium]HRV48882.1 response regulator [Sedimentisphaerales bacterium]
MEENERQHVFVVDDEPDVCEALRRTLEQAGYEVRCFDSATTCLVKMRSARCDLLITDVVLPGMDGIELLSEVKCRTPSLPVLVVTGYGNVEMAVEVMAAGAANFLQKPLGRDSFLAAVEAALKHRRRAREGVRKPLTRSEIEVLRLILDGKGNKEIARLRHRSVRTIEDQRRRIMHKFGVDNPVDLIREVAIVRMPRQLHREQLSLPFDRS